MTGGPLVQHSCRTVENIDGCKLLFHVIHHLCGDGTHRCCEFVLELHPRVLQLSKLRLYCSIGIIVASYAFLSKFATSAILLTTLLSIGAVILVIWHQTSMVIKESILVEMGVTGIQQSQVDFFGRHISTVMHKKDIEDVIINEAITMNSVIFYLGVLMNDQSVKPLFQNLLPRLDCLQAVYQEMQNSLWEHLDNT